jgi:hypothetical protein
LTEEATPPKRRYCYLPMSSLILLDAACIPIHEAFSTEDNIFGIYHVGSSTQRPDYRDVDVRAMLDDVAFDDLFLSRPRVWSLMCLALSEYLARITGLPIDFQFQRMTEANAEYGSHFRNPLGHGREYAGGLYFAAGVAHLRDEP